MYGTEIMRFFYSYLVILGHYSRVILCLILVFNQYFRGQLESIEFWNLVGHRNSGER